MGRAASRRRAALPTALTVKSRSAQVGLDRVAAKRAPRRAPAAMPGHDPPGPELVGELEGVPRPDSRGDLARGSGDVAGEREVDVGDVAAEGGVAHRAADHPGPSAPRAAGGRLAPRSPPRLDPRRVRRSSALSSRLARRGPAATEPSPAGDLVVDRLQPPCQLLGRDPLVALRADQHRRRPRPHLGLGAEVDRDVVHRDRADQRVAAAADQHLAVVGERRAARRRRSRSGSTPTHVSAGALPASGRSRRWSPAREPLDVGDVGAQRERRLEAALGRVPAERVEPVDRDRRSGPCRSGSGARAASRRCWRRGAMTLGVAARGRLRDRRGSARAARRRNESSSSSAVAKWVQTPARLAPARRRELRRRAGSARTARARRAGPCRCRA